LVDLQASLHLALRVAFRRGHAPGVCQDPPGLSFVVFPFRSARLTLRDTTKTMEF
jgi:hypothetical protein